MLVNLSSGYSLFIKYLTRTLLIISPLLLVLNFIGDFEFPFWVAAFFIGFFLYFSDGIYYMKTSYPLMFDNKHLYIGKERVLLEDLLEVEILRYDLYRIKIKDDQTNYYYQSNRSSWFDAALFSYSFNKKTKELIRRSNEAKENS